jgi:hypothetical protein
MYEDIPSYDVLLQELGDEKRALKKELKNTKRMLEIAKELVMGCNMYDWYERQCREEGLIPEREDDDES